MALQSTSKVKIFVSTKNESEVLSFLQERGAIDFSSCSESVRSDIDHSGEFAVAKLDFAIRYLSKYEQKKKGLRNVVLGEKIEVSSFDASHVLSSFDWESVVDTISKLEGQKNDIHRELLEAKVVLSSLKDLGGVTIESTSSRFAPSFFVLPLRTAEVFEKEVMEITDLLDLSQVEKSEKNISFVLFSSQEVRENVLDILSRCKGSEVIVDRGVSPAQKIKNLSQRISDLEIALQKNEEDAKTLLVHLSSLKICYDFFDDKKGVNSVLRGSQKTEFLSVFEGWIDASEKETLQNDLERAFGAVAIEEISLEKSEKSPIILKNSKLVTPFEVVTNMYGAPQSNEIDPTPFLAPFFVVFFGLCLTDAAYGLMLAGAMGFVLSAKLPLDFGVQKMIRLLFYSGLSTAFFGLLFGGWFGISPESVSTAFTYVNASGETMFLGQIVNPTVDLVDKIAPLVLLGGLLHLLLGVGLKGYMAMKKGNQWDMWMVAIPTILTISLGVVAVVAKMFGLLEGVESVLMNIIIASFIVMTVGIMKSGGPIAWFMDVTGWLSNTLSYARLFALGLATGIVAQVFNTVAFAIGGMMPTGLNILVIVFIILFGHTLNIALNLLGAFVHSGRLQFVEFFGQFLEGGGRYFSPLKKSSRFIYTSV